MALLAGYRLRRGPALVLLIAVGVIGSLLILRSQLRPALDVYNPVTVDQAAAGTTYAVDDQLCLRGAQVGATVRSVDVGGVVTGLQVAGARPVIAFPVDPEDGEDLVGARVPARDDLCVRLLVSGEEQGSFRAPEVSISLRYGPLGLFRRTFDVTPPTTLVVDRTGRDPRLDAP